MNIHCKLYKFIFIFLFFLNCSVLASDKIQGVESYQLNIIDASTNARTHSNMGNIYFEQKNYVGALKEYEIAYALSSNSRMGAVYLYNMARCYITLNRYQQAKNMLTQAIKRDYTNITYYNALADCTIALKNSDKEIKKYLSDTTNPYNRVLVGLIYLKQGKIAQAKTIFDDFIAQNPNIIMADDIRTILRNL